MKTQTIWVDGFQGRRGALGTENELLSPGGPGAHLQSLWAAVSSLPQAFRRAGVPRMERRRWTLGREAGCWQWRWVAELQRRHPASIGSPGWEVAQSERAHAMFWGYTCVLWLSVLTDTGDPEAVSGRASV